MRHRLTASGSQYKVFFRSKFLCTIQQQAAVLSKHIIAVDEMRQFFSHLHYLYKYHNLTPFFPWLIHGIGYSKEIYQSLEDTSYLPFPALHRQTAKFTLGKAAWSHIYIWQLEDTRLALRSCYT